MADYPRFAGHRLTDFSPATKRTLKEVAERLIPHEKSILDGWISRQFKAWQPPGFSRESLSDIFSGLVSSILQGMRSGELEACVDSLERAGADLAGRQFPFDALLISVHFFEETYLRFLLSPPPPNPRKWLVTTDEFLHVALAAISTAYFETYRRELLDRAEVGRVVQESLLADIPDMAADLEIAHIYISAREQAQLGGDILDCITIGPDSVAFLVGDLSGHGLEAVADSLMLRSLFRGFMREQPDLSNTMGRLNRVLYSDLPSGQFATALAVSYGSGGALTVVNAGHPHPVLCDDACRLVELDGMALAIEQTSIYKAQDLQLKPGGVFVAYTDGLVEARGKSGMFGEDGLLETVASMRDASARAIAEQLVDNAQRHAGGRCSDDVAVLVLRRSARVSDENAVH